MCSTKNLIYVHTIHSFLYGSIRALAAYGYTALQRNASCPIISPSIDWLQYFARSSPGLDIEDRPPPPPSR
ncbi:hypothetical protein SPHINGOT1_120092 [Sphingomonas sp. T1]|nr:hypothetical protein SPHINGOT1_120092 [Sphingomonas sp. T1]